MAYYTYPAPGFGFMPNPDSVQDHDTINDAFTALIEDVRITAEFTGLDMPAVLPTIEDVREAVERGGFIFGFAGWLHVVGVDA